MVVMVIWLAQEKNVLIVALLIEFIEVEKEALKKERERILGSEFSRSPRDY